MTLCYFRAHLNIVGFRKYAIELVKFLEKEVYGGSKKMYDKNDKKRNENADAALKVLIKNEFFEEWEQFGIK